MLIGILFVCLNTAGYKNERVVLAEQQRELHQTEMRVIEQRQKENEKQRQAEKVPEVAPQPVVVRAAPSTAGVEQWRSLVEKYFPANQVGTALAVMRCESGGNPNAVGDSTTAYSSYGLMQIRALPGRPSPNQLVDAEFNIQYAAQLYNSSGWSPWTCIKYI